MRNVVEVNECRAEDQVGSRVLEGSDLSSPIDVLFLAGAGEAEIATLQHVGRALRKRPDKDRVLIYDSLDGRGPLQKKDYLYRHSQSRIATYRKEHWEIEESF